MRAFVVYNIRFSGLTKAGKDRIRLGGWPASQAAGITSDCFFAYIIEFEFAANRGSSHAVPQTAGEMRSTNPSCRARG